MNGCFVTRFVNLITGRTTGGGLDPGLGLADGAGLGEGAGSVDVGLGNGVGRTLSADVGAGWAAGTASCPAAGALCTSPSSAASATGTTGIASNVPRPGRPVLPGPFRPSGALPAPEAFPLPGAASCRAGAQQGNAWESYRLVDIPSSDHE